ncbi:MAG TPA: hypothetical protein VII97_06010 [Anaerolineales bacterium]
MQKLHPWLTRLYPRDWRERYEAEFTALLEQCLNSPLDVLDVILGAVDAHLRLLSGDSLKWRVMNMLNKIRTTILIVFAAYIGFVIAGFSLVGLADDSPMAALMKTNPALSATWTTIQAGAVVALLAVVIGGLPLAITVIRRALSGSHRGLGLLLVPVFAFLALVAYVGFVLAVGFGRIQLPGVFPVVQPGVFPPGNRLLMAGLTATLVLGATASTLAVWKAVTDMDVENETFHVIRGVTTVKIYNFAFLPAVITALAMLVMLAATIAWGWISFSALPQVLAGNYGPWGTSTQAWFIGIITLMTISILVAFFGLVRGRSVQKMV